MKNYGILEKLSVLELNKLLRFEFRYDYETLKCGEKAKLGYMDTDSFIVCIKIDDIDKDIVEDVETTIVDKIFAIK